MSDPVAIITGGTKGLGRELSLIFARNGHFVIALYSKDEAAARELEANIEASGARGRATRHDVRGDVEGSGVWSAPEVLRAERLTFIHAACPPIAPTPFHRMAWDDASRQIDVAVKGCWLSVQALLRAMVARKRGTIVNVLTRIIHGSPPQGLAGYVVAKHALRGLTLALASEYRRRGVKIFSASPGFMMTGLTAGLSDEVVRKMQTGGAGSEPQVVARRIYDLVASDGTPGCGEDYPL